MKTFLLLTATAVVTTLAPTTFAQDSDAFIESAASAAKRDLPDGYMGVQGADKDWYFFYKELAHLGKGKFWENNYSENTESGVDPAPIILKYHEALEAIGVELLLVPVPPKASIYPEKFQEQGAPAALAPFYKKLTDAGVQVLDLEPIFEAERKKNPDALLYCKTDSHYSPYAAQLIANQIHQKYADSDWVKAIEATTKFAVAEEATITIDGDLIPDGKEELPATKVTDASGEQVQPATSGSPIVLLGDSHTAVFSTGAELHAKARGLIDHLQAKFGTPLEHIANNGSGVHQARAQLIRKVYQKDDFWSGKKLLIWHFTARDFTQEPKWIEIPVSKK